MDNLPGYPTKAVTETWGPGKRGLWALAAAGLLLVVVLVWWEAARTAPVRDAVRTYTALISAANRGDIEAANRLCTARFLATHPLKPAGGGGLTGLPRGIHKNFRAWQEGPRVWLCPTSPESLARPVYQLRVEAGEWRFDGLIGHLRPGGIVERAGPVPADAPSSSPAGTAPFD